MIDDGILKMVFARDNIPDLAVEAYLSAKPGMIGAIGFQRIAESHAAQTKRADAATAELARIQAHHASSHAEMSALKEQLDAQQKALEDAARIEHGLAPESAVTPEQVASTIGDLHKKAALPVANRCPAEEPADQG